MSTKTIDRSGVGVLAGEGELPLQLTRYCADNEIPIAIVQFDMCDYGEFPIAPILQTRIERVGEIFSFFKDNNVKNVVMIGNLQKPSFTSLRPDVRGLKTLTRIAKAFVSGDDSLLRALRIEIEKEGYNVRGVDYYLTQLTCKLGQLTKKKCDIDIRDATKESLRYGTEDRGQSVLLHSDGTYSYETRTGTTALIDNEGRAGSVLVKMVKPQQDPDLDRPTVGMQTLIALKSKGCAGMVVEADGVLLINQDEMINYANEHNLFIEGVNG